MAFRASPTERNLFDRLEFFSGFLTVLPKLCTDLLAHVNGKRPLRYTFLCACVFTGVAFGA